MRLSIGIAIALMSVYMCAVAVGVAAQLPMPYPTGGLGHGMHCVTESWGEPMFVWNYTQLYFDQFTSEWYLLPSAVYAVPIDRLDSSDVLNYYEEADAYYSQEVSNWGLSAKLQLNKTGLSATLSRTHGRIESRMQAGARYFSAHSRTYELNQLSLYHSAPLAPNFVDDVAALPSAYDQHAYVSFLETYGTYVPTTLITGGTVNVTLAYDWSLINSKGSQWTNEQIAASIGFMEAQLKFDGQFAGNTTAIDKEFAVSSDLEQYSTGGDLAVLTSFGYKAWLFTVPKQPAFLPHAHPANQWNWIFDYVSDPVRNANFVRAVEDVCSGAVPPSASAVVHTKDGD